MLQFLLNHLYKPLKNKSVPTSGSYMRHIVLDSRKIVYCKNTLNTVKVPLAMGTAQKIFW